MADLRARILDEIASNGPMRFSRYMELALYDETEGFFARTAPGPDGHFVTAPHISGVFVEMLARAAERARAAVGEPFEFVDIGAGDGTLLAGLADAVGAPATGVDRSAAARAALERRGLTAREDLPQTIAGLIVCNELFDNLPFDLIDRDTGDEIVLGADLRPTGEIAKARTQIGDAAREMVASIARALATGYVLIVDYADLDEPVRGYAGQRPVHDVLEAPGGSDITGPVDLGALATAATTAGLVVQARTTQRELLLALGYREHLDQMRARQDAARNAGDHATEIVLWNARGEAAMLVDPQGMGAYGVLILATAGMPPLLD